MWPFPKQLKPQKKASALPPMKKYLFAGLGNPENKYTNTRHNIGFQALDYFAAQHALEWQSGKLATYTTYKIKGRTVYFIKPNTYMNLSGKAVKYWVEKEKIPLENTVIITDDLNLPFGTLRLKLKGSDGGHNGLKHIQDTLKTNKYPRLRFGIGDTFNKGTQINYVLGQWQEAEANALPERLEKIVQLLTSFVWAGPAQTMSQFNGK